MSTWIIELYYRPPSDAVLEEELIRVVSAAGGWFDCREAPEVDASSYVCLTYEFDDLSAAERVAGELRLRGHHVEGVSLYS